MLLLRTDEMRLHSIDAFRGLAIVLMVLYTLGIMLEAAGGVFTHNAEGSLHLGDFVLPMFLFASGMSLVFFHEKRKKKSRTEYALDVMERFGKFVLISMFLSPFSAGGFLQMDEVMLSAVLFLACILLIGLPGFALFIAGLAVFVLYFALSSLSLLPDFSLHYLGGYPAAIFYLPVMLGGIIVGKQVAAKKELLMPLFCAISVSALLLFIIGPWKMDASPSFMALSVALSLLVFVLMKDFRNEHLEYLGQHPFRYWVLMYVLLKIPLMLYAMYAGLDVPLGWGSALILTLLCVPALYLASRGIDFLLKPHPEAKGGKTH